MTDDVAPSPLACCLREFMDEQLLKALCEPVRVELLAWLAEHGPSEVGQVADAFPQDRSVISRHLRQLAEAGVLCREKRSRSVLYSVDGGGLLSRLEAMVEQTRALVMQCCPPAEPED